MKQIALLLCAVAFASGCSHTLEVTNATDYSRRAIDSSQAGLTVSVEASDVSPEGERLVSEVAMALMRQGGYSVVYPKRTGVETDVACTIRVTEGERQGSWQNVVILWPGSIFFMPAWLGYRYTIDFTVTCELTNGATGERIQTLTFPIVLALRHADFGRTWMNCWWFGILSLPNGLYCVTYDDDIDDELPQRVFPMLGGHIATSIIRSVNALPWENAAP